MRSQVPDDIAELVRGKPHIHCHGRIVKPKLEFLVTGTNVDVRGLIPFVRVEEGTRWPPRRTVGTTPVQQQIYGNVGSDGLHRWMGSLAVDKDGNMALGYSVSSGTVSPDIRYAGRLAGDTLGTLPQGETTMLSDADRRKAADILMTAEKERRQAVQLSKTWPDITMDDAYAISTEVAQRKVAAGARLIGHKVGLTSKAMQRSSQIDEPDYGHLLDGMMIADGAKIPHERYCRPRVEIELAFVMGKPLKGPGVGLTDVLRATEYVVPAIEIVDARLQDPRRIFDTVADNGAAAGIVVGGRPVGPLDVDLRWVGGIMYRNSEIEETGVAAGVLGHPALGVAWLANKLGSHGVALEPGHLVLAGSFTRVVFAHKGDTLHADFGALGGIAVQFV